MTKKVYIAPKKYLPYEHLDQILKTTMAERLIWLAQASKTVRLLQKAMAKAKAKIKG